MKKRTKKHVTRAPKNRAKTRKPRSTINTDINFREFQLGKLNPAKYNPRTISEDNLLGLRKSLEKFGLVEPIIVNIRDGRNVIVGGHQRYKVLLAAGVSSVPCVTVDRNDKDEKLLNLSLNNPEIQGEFIAEINQYIEKLQKYTGDDIAFLELRIDQLKREILGPEGLTDEFRLPDGDRSPLQQMTFTLTDEQAETVRVAVKKSKNMGEFKETVNKNNNGNALARICEIFLESK